MIQSIDNVKIVWYNPLIIEERNKILWKEQSLISQNLTERFTYSLRVQTLENPS